MPEADNGECLGLFRAHSMEVTNDPRFFHKNVLLKRMGAFHVIAVTAVLIANLSCMQMLQMESSKFNGIKGNIRYVAFVLFSTCFVLNLVTVVIIVQQLFQMTRLATAGSTGFELAKSYYLNPNIVSMRHLAANIFFVCIPIFLAAVGLTIYVKLGGRLNLMWSLPISIVLFFAAIILRCFYEKHRNVFQQKYELAVTQHEPLLTQLTHKNMQTAMNPLRD